MDNFKFTNDIFSLCTDFEIEFHAVNNPLLFEFSKVLFKLRRDLIDYQGDRSTQSFLEKMSKFGFNIVSAPLPPSYLGDKGEKAFEQLSILGKSIGQRYPEMEPDITKLLLYFKQLLTTTNNPLLDKVISVTQLGSKTALVFCNTGKFSFVESLLRQRQNYNIQVVSLDYFNSSIDFDHIIFVGSTNWLHKYQFLFTAPRAEKTSVISYDWLTVKLPENQAFIKNSVLGLYGIKFRKYMETQRVPFFDIEEPQVRIEGFTDNHSENENNLEAAMAKMVILVGDMAVYLEDDISSKVLALQEIEDTDLSRLAVPDLKSEMYIVLRTEENGDYVVDVANTILGPRAQSLRDVQRSWKKDLALFNAKHGSVKTCLKLIECGCDIASDINLRNWINPRNIKTKKREHFEGILKVIGRSSEIDLIWDSLQSINEAHIQAGQVIRNKIINSLDKQKKTILKQYGRVDLSLSGVNVGVLSVFKIHSILPEAVFVDQEILGQPFKIGEI